MHRAGSAQAAGQRFPLTVCPEHVEDSVQDLLVRHAQPAAVGFGTRGLQCSLSDPEKDGTIARRPVGTSRFFGGDDVNLTFWNIDRRLARVNVDEQRPMIDLSDATFFEPFALVYLGMYLRHFNNLSKSFDVNPPHAHAPRDYLARVNFWERFNFNPEIIEQEKLRRFSSTTSFNDMLDIEKTNTIAEDIAENVRWIIRNNAVGVDADMMAEVVSELVDNFAQHSQRLLAACAMQYYPAIGRMIFAIGDCGIGIRGSLASNPQYAYLAERPHREAAALAFEPLVSRKIEGGTGLTEVADAVMAAKGRLLLSTGDGYVKLK